jgi:hypothetical protein
MSQFGVMRGLRVVRDNIIFELGLFLGAFGQKRTFVVCDRAVVRSIPSDLLGVTLATYKDDGAREATKIRRSLNRAARQIRNALVSRVDRYEVDFLKAYPTFIRPPIDFGSNVLEHHHSPIRRNSPRCNGSRTASGLASIACGESTVGQVFSSIKDAISKVWNSGNFMSALWNVKEGRPTRSGSQ